MNAKPDRIKLAIAAVIFSGFAVAFGDAVAKFIGSEVSLWQIFSLRSLFAVAIIIAIIHFASVKAPLLPHSIFWVGVRSATFASAAITFYIGLPYVHLSLMTALLFVFPVFVVGWSAIYGTDSVTPRIAAALACGVIGMLFIIRPATGDFNIYALLGLAAAIFYAATMLITRFKCEGENPKTIGLWQNIGILIFGAVGAAIMQIWQPDAAAENHFVLGGWVSLTAFQWAILGVIALSFMLFSIFNAFAYQNAPVPIVATFDYSFLLAALFWGWVILSETPSYLDIIGIAVIAAAGILIVRNPAAAKTAR